MEATTWQEYSQVSRTFEQQKGKQMRTRPDGHAPIEYKQAAFPEICPLLFHIILDTLLQSVQVIEALQSAACSQSSCSAHAHPEKSCKCFKKHLYHRSR